MSKKLQAEIDDLENQIDQKTEKIRQNSRRAKARFAKTMVGKCIKTDYSNDHSGHIHYIHYKKIEGNRIYYSSLNISINKFGSKKIESISWRPHCKSLLSDVRKRDGMKIISKRTYQDALKLYLGKQPFKT